MTTPTHKNHKCSKYYILEDDGLSKDWSDEVVFMSPPNGGNAGDWVKKALSESRKGTIVVCLIASSTDRSYWHDSIFPYAAQIRFVRGRLKYRGAVTTAPFASAVVVFTEKYTYADRIVYYDKSVAAAQGRGERQIAATASRYPKNFLAINI